MPENLRLTETTASSLTEAAVNQNGQTLLRLIAPGWSKNGRYYSEDLLKGDGLKAFREGVQNYLNHPSKSEEIDRPERSVRDLVGTLKENAYYDPRGPVGPGLYARASVRDEYQPIVGDLAESIGMSIRADGTGHHGEAEGRAGLIVDSIEEVKSVDYVTSPAAGGKVVQLIESVQNPDRETDAPTDPEGLREARNAADWIEVEIHRGVLGLVNHMWENGNLTRDEWAAVNSATADAMDAFRSSLTTAIPDLLTRDPLASAEPEATEMSESTSTTETSTDESSTEASPTPSDPETAPADDAGTTADPPGSATPDVTDSQEGTMTESTSAPPVTPAALSTTRQLMEAELSTERQARALAEARERARQVLAGGLAEAWVPPATVARITESLLTTLPLDNDRKLDETKLLEAAKAQLDQAETEMAEALSAAGVGRPRDLGYRPEDTSYRGEQHTTELTETFKRLGMSESAAKLAAEGRV